MFFFKNHRKRNEVNAFMRRLADRTTPTLRSDSETRQELRVNRSLPVLLIPLVDEKPNVELTAFGVTKNLSSLGAAILTQRPVTTDLVAVGFWHENHCDFIQGEIRYRKPVEGGYWQFGLQLREVIPRGEFRVLSLLGDMADRLTADDDPAAFESAFARI
ncbi:PilZ domain protein [Symmachiella macrocystis]|uniref:PilZ domain protein n=1 Tax=Symmachiella macrocystis TaxID=2527985 RepID=A0A5C6BC58_9PLAN|nr:hypothetical protein [Symmachiella macrocystis]TWU09588.1 PilZ domain protein [Symmachiella macrocystis]